MNRRLCNGCENGKRYSDDNFSVIKSNNHKKEPVRRFLLFLSVPSYIYTQKQDMAGNNSFIYLALALICGVLIPIQAATNAAYSRHIQNVGFTALMIFATGLLAIIVYLLATRVAIPPAQKLVSAPVYGYLGGIIVATYVILVTILVPRIGVGTTIGLIVTGQILCAVVIDQFGFFNVTVRQTDVSRAIGVVLMIVGVYLVMKKQA